MHFRERNVLYFDENFTDVCFYGSNSNQPCIGLDNGLVPNRRYAIIWTNAGSVYWRIYTALEGDELNPYKRQCIVNGVVNKRSNVQTAFTAKYGE